MQINTTFSVTVFILTCNELRCKGSRVLQRLNVTDIIPYCKLQIIGLQVLVCHIIKFLVNMSRRRNLTNHAYIVQCKHISKCVCVMKNSRETDIFHVSIFHLLVFQHHESLISPYLLCVIVKHWEEMSSCKSSWSVVSAYLK